MTSTELSAAAGIALSLAMNYIPGLSERYKAFSSQEKSLIMLGLLVLTALVVFQISCTGWWKFVNCDEKGIKDLIEAFVAALVANQATFLISPQKETAAATTA